MQIIALIIFLVCFNRIQLRWCSRLPHTTKVCANKIFCVIEIHLAEYFSIQLKLLLMPIDGNVV